MKSDMQSAQPSSEIVFVIPFISKSAAREKYDHACELLGETLNSIRRQHRKNFSVVLVSNDRPAIDLRGIDFVCSNTRAVRPDNPASYQVDKEVKLGIGLIKAQEYQPKYIIPFDADDLLSPNFTIALAACSADVVVLKSGFISDFSKGLAYPTPNFYKICGSPVAFSPFVPGMPTKSLMDRPINHSVQKEELWTINGHKQDILATAHKMNLSVAFLRRPHVFYRVWSESLSSSGRRLRLSERRLWLIFRLIYLVACRPVRRRAAP